MSEKKLLPVSGMSCAACAVNVEKALNKVDGVESANVNFANHTASVSYNSSTNLEKLKRAVQEVGYDLDIPADAAGQNEEVYEKVRLMQEEHYQSLSKRSAGAIIVALPVFLLGMFGPDDTWVRYLSMVLTALILGGFGRDFFVNAWKQARHRYANMDTLVAVSTGVAFVFSSINTVFPQFLEERGLTPHVYFEAAAVIVAFVLLGKRLEARATNRTSDAIKGLMELQPDEVVVVDGESERLEAVENIVIGDLLRVKPGGRVAVDGVVESGQSYVDESMLTGESIPVLKEIGERLVAGTINQKGTLTYRASAVGTDTVLARIVRRVREAQGSKAPVQKMVDRIAGIFVPVVLGISLLTFAIWYFSGIDQAFIHALMASITVLVIACPCALGLATPTAIMAGVGAGAQRGILIRDAESLEKGHRVTDVVLDKTGTITTGLPEVRDALIVDSEANWHILEAIESLSEHPLANAVVTWIRTREQPRESTPIISAFESVTGHGIRAEAEGKQYVIGKLPWLKEMGIEWADEVEAWIQEQGDEARTVFGYTRNGSLIALLALADPVKPEAEEAIARLKRVGITVHMLTGDQFNTAAAVARSVGIDHVKAEVLPDDKYEYVEELQRTGKHVAMVGDGINDAQALALADVSIAMGSGTDIAMDAARVTLMRDDLNGVPDALRLSRVTVNTIRQNLFWAFIYNLIGIPIAAGVLYPAYGFMLNPMIAAAAMGLSSVSVVTNSLRLRAVFRAKTTSLHS